LVPPVCLSFAGATMPPPPRRRSIFFCFSIPPLIRTPLSSPFSRPHPLLDASGQPSPIYYNYTFFFMRTPHICRLQIRDSSPIETDTFSFHTVVTQDFPLLYVFFLFLFFFPLSEKRSSPHWLYSWFLFLQKPFGPTISRVENFYDVDKEPWAPSGIPAKENRTDNLRAHISLGPLSPPFPSSVCAFPKSGPVSPQALLLSVPPFHAGSVFPPPAA